MNQHGLGAYADATVAAGFEELGTLFAATESLVELMLEGEGEGEGEERRRNRLLRIL